MGCDGMRIGGVASFYEFLLALYPPAAEEPHLAEKCDESSVREPFKTDDCHDYGDDDDDGGSDTDKKETLPQCGFALR